MGKKNLLLIVDQLHRGGAQKVISNLSTNLANDCNVHLAIFNDIDKVEFSYSGTLLKIKLPFSDNPSANGTVQRMIRMITLIRRLRQIKRKYKIEVSISFLEASNIVNVLSSRGEKIIVSVRSYLSRELQDVKKVKIYRQFVKLLYNKAASVVVPSGMISKDLVDRFGVNPNKTVVIPNFVDANRIGELQIEKIDACLESVYNYPTLVTVGRFEPVKGQRFLFPILSLVKKELPQIKLIIVGGGPDEPAFIEDAKASGLKVFAKDEIANCNESDLGSGDVFILGHQKNPFKYLANGAVFIFPSLYEGFPNALLEALACSMPAISADCTSGPREILAPETPVESKTERAEYAKFGILVPDTNVFANSKPGDEQYNEALTQWSEAIKTIFKNESMRKSYMETARIRSKDFSKETIVPQWLGIINE